MIVYKLKTLADKVVDLVVVGCDPVVNSVQNSHIYRLLLLNLFSRAAAAIRTALSAVRKLDFLLSLRPWLLAFPSQWDVGTLGFFWCFFHELCNNFTADFKVFASVGTHLSQRFSVKRYACLSVTVTFPLRKETSAAVFHFKHVE